MEAEGLEKKKSSKLKFVIIPFAIIMLGIIACIIYFNNDTFKFKVDELLTKLPWIDDKDNISLLTDDEIREKVGDLAEYYLSLKPENAADKLYIIKKDDEILYSETVKQMNKKSSSKTSKIIKLVRNLDDRDNILASIHEEISQEKNNLLAQNVKRLENQDILVTITEIKNRLNSDENFKQNLPGIFTSMSEDTAANILYYIDEVTKDKIINSISDDKRSSLENKITSKRNKHTELVDLASLYETKPFKTAFNEIGNTETYSYEELGVIYSNLSVLRSAEILSRIEDNTFIQELFAAIRKEEQLNGKEPIVNKVSEAIEFITEYNRKIDDLVTVYEAMEPAKVARIVEEMINNNATVTVLEIESKPIFEISDASIITEVLSRIKNKFLSNILNYMSVENASKLTQILARP